jgi:hypothetical protein
VPFILVFRTLHILAGVLWVGSAFLFVGFIGPSAVEVGPSALPLLAAAVKKRKVAKVITGLGGVTVLAGWARRPGPMDSQTSTPRPTTRTSTGWSSAWPPSTT